MSYFGSTFAFMLNKLVKYFLKVGQTNFFIEPANFIEISNSNNFVHYLCIIFGHLLLQYWIAYNNHKENMLWHNFICGFHLVLFWVSAYQSWSVSTLLFLVQSTQMFFQGRANNLFYGTCKFYWNYQKFK